MHGVTYIMNYNICKLATSQTVYGQMTQIKRKRTESLYFVDFSSSDF